MTALGLRRKAIYVRELLDGVEEFRLRARADRPSPAIPLLLLAAVVAGALVVALIRAGQMYAPAGSSAEFVGLEFTPSSDWVRLGYWVVASIVAYASALWIARRQGYRSGVWVDRLPLAMGGIGALVVSVIVAVGWYTPGDLLIRGNVPLLAIAVGVVVWAIRERLLGLWVVAALTVLLALLANLYDMENVLLRLGVPDFDNAEEITNLGAVAVALFAAAAVFGLLHRRDVRALRAPGER